MTRLPEFQYRPVAPCGMGCGNTAPGVYVWAWGEGEHRTERSICAECVCEGKPEYPPILDATPEWAKA